MVQVTRMISEKLLHKLQRKCIGNCKWLTHAMGGTNVAFFEVQFPVKIGFGAVGGPSWSTLINAGLSGFEQRNKNWVNTRYKYQLDLVTQAVSVFQNVLDFFLAVNGKGDAF